MSTADIEARTELQPLASPALEHQISQAEPKDFFALMKPGVMRLVVFTALVGMVSAAATSDTVLLEPVTGAIALLCIAIGGGASGALNMWYEADLDRLMKRTAKRPIPAGRVSRNEALGFGMFMAALSVMILGLVANVLAAGFHDFLLYRGLYDLAETLHAAEYRYRRCCRRVAAGCGLGCNDGICRH